jgi:hypothetical protein
MTTTAVSVSARSTTSTASRFSNTKSETAARTKAATKTPARKAYARSPYRERTVMLRVPESLAQEFRLRLEQHKQTVAAGDHDNWD